MSSNTGDGAGMNKTRARMRTLNELIDFARDWIAAGGCIVQDWDGFEAKAAQFFGWFDPPEQSAVMHGLMTLVCAVCFGSPDDVKRVARELSPSTLILCPMALSHLPEFSVIFEAESRYRRGELAGDWSLSLVNDKLVVRSMFRQAGGIESH